MTEQVNAAPVPSQLLPAERRMPPRSHAGAHAPAPRPERPGSSSAEVRQTPSAASGSSAGGYASPDTPKTRAAPGLPTPTPVPPSARHLPRSRAIHARRGAPRIPAEPMLEVRSPTGAAPADRAHARQALLRQVAGALQPAAGVQEVAGSPVEAQFVRTGWGNDRPSPARLIPSVA